MVKVFGWRKSLRRFYFFTYGYDSARFFTHCKINQNYTLSNSVRNELYMSPSLGGYKFRELLKISITSAQRKVYVKHYKI
jgi:hypothetical protein